jgi:hypothetical protein
MAQQAAAHHDGEAAMARAATAERRLLGVPTAAVRSPQWRQAAEGASGGSRYIWHAADTSPSYA